MQSVNFFRQFVSLYRWRRRRLLLLRLSARLRWLPRRAMATATVGSAARAGVLVVELSAPLLQVTSSFA